MKFGWAEETVRPSVTILPAVGAITLALVAMEAMNHARGHGADAFGGTVRALPSPWFGGTVLYVGGYLASLLVLRVRRNRAALRRTAFGFMLQILMSALAPPSVRPCLQVALVCFLWRTSRSIHGRAWDIGLVVLAILLASNALVTGRHDVAGVLSGGAVGWLSYRIAFAGALEFLDADHPWGAVRFQLAELWNLAVFNRRNSWEAAYSAGHWDFLRALDQKPRHYAVAGVVVDRCSEPPHVLDVGCGEAVLYPCLRGRIASYTGLDFAKVAIDRCRVRYRHDPRCRFEALPFEDYEPTMRFDVVVMSEILYYFPLAATEATCARAAALLADDDGILIVSLCRNLKARLCAQRLARVATPEQSIRVRNNSTGSHWTVMVYRRRAFERVMRRQGGGGNR